jgi:hypothetical protein
MRFHLSYLKLILCFFVFSGYYLNTETYAGDINIERSDVGGDVVGRDKITIKSPEKKTLLQLAAGNWRLSSYAEHTAAGMAPYFEINEGTLLVDKKGIARWTVVVKDYYGGPKFGPLEITSTGQILLNRRIRPMKGGEYNSVNHKGPWQLDIKMTELAVFGWSTGEPPDPFSISVEGNMLEMSNSRSTFSWYRQ